MITPSAALNLVREELRTCVLPRLAEDDDYGRSVLVAAIGVLGELAPRVIDDAAWTVEPTARLEEAAAGWHAQLATERGGEAATGDDTSPQERRAGALTTCDAAAAALWAGAPDASGPSNATLHRLRAEFLAALSQDVGAELAARTTRP